MIGRFFVYGIIGWCLEIVFTGVLSGLNGNRSLKATTSLWMFPIYGMAVFLEPFFTLLGTLPFVLRGVIYMALIFGTEFISGLVLLGVVGSCPWDYKEAKANIAGVIRLDYAPLWFAVGLLYERIFWILSYIL